MCFAKRCFFLSGSNLVNRNFQLDSPIRQRGSPIWPKYSKTKFDRVCFICAFWNRMCGSGLITGFPSEPKLAAKPQMKQKHPTAALLQKQKFHLLATNSEMNNEIWEVPATWSQLQMSIIVFTFVWLKT